MTEWLVFIAAVAVAFVLFWVTARLVARLLKDWNDASRLVALVVVGLGAGAVMAYADDIPPLVVGAVIVLTLGFYIGTPIRGHGRGWWHHVGTRLSFWGGLFGSVLFIRVLS